MGSLLSENARNQASPRIPAQNAAAQTPARVARRDGHDGASSSPHVTADASSHRATTPTPGTIAAAAAAAATAATASAGGDPAGAGNGGSVTRDAASAVNHSRTGPAFRPAHAASPAPSIPAAQAAP